MKIVQKTWGYEIEFANNELYCGKELVCEDEKWSSKGWYHYHPVKDETFYIIEGTLLLDVEGKEMLLYPLSMGGGSHRIRPGVRHRFRSVGKRCKFIEVSTTHREEDSIRVESL